MSNNNLSADEMAEKGKVKRSRKEERRAALQKRSAQKNGIYQKVLDQKRIFKHITRWYSWRLIFLWLSIICMVSGLPFLIIGSMMGDDPEFYKGFIILFAVPLVVFYLLNHIAKYISKNKAKQEKEWIDNLPFEIIGFPDFLTYRSYPLFDVTVVFERKVPGQEYFLNVLATLPNDIEDLQSPSKKTTKEFLPDNEVEKELLEKIMADREEENHPNQFKFIVRNERASKFDQNRRWAYKWVHNACDSQLKAINEQFPIKTVIIGNGTKELDFDWWIPLKQKGFLFLQ